MKIESATTDPYFTCPACEATIDTIQDIMNAQAIRKGNIVICQACASILKIGDSNLEKFKREDFHKLDAQSRALIMLTVTGILAKKQGERQ